MSVFTYRDKEGVEVATTISTTTTTTQDTTKEAKGSGEAGKKDGLEPLQDAVELAAITGIEIRLHIENCSCAQSMPSSLLTVAYLMYV